MTRIVINGVTGSGKTTLARRLSRRLGAPLVELDALFWDAGWQPVGDETFRARVGAALDCPTWVVDGNYLRLRDLTWARASRHVWLDYPLPLILARLLRRTTRRVLTGETLWNNNRETWRGAFFSRDSLFLYALTSYRKHRREIPRLLALPEFAHLRTVRLRSPAQTARWLEGLENWSKIG